MPFNIVCPASRGLSFALACELLTRTPNHLFATARSDLDAVKARILERTSVPENRVTLLKVDVKDEDTISSAAAAIREKFPEDHIGIMFSTPGILHPERSPADLTKENIVSTFNTNLLGPLLLMKHFSPLLPRKTVKPDRPAIWVNITARVGSIGDNRLGGWYSYRSAKAGLNQATKTFDIYLKAKHPSAFAVAMHPGTVKTELSRPYWSGVPEGKLFEPEDSASKILDVVDCLGLAHRGRFYDWEGKEIPW